MITSVFRKSTPLNYSIIIIGLVLFFFLYQINHGTGSMSAVSILEKIAMLGVISFSLFTASFIIKKNGLSKDSSYTVLFFLLFLLFFPSIFTNFNLVLSNFFVLLGFRRLVSLQSLKAPKEKIFDASLWVFVAALFNFWSILFILLVFTAILFHVAKDYRNWILPFIAFFTIATLFTMLTLIFDKPWITDLINESQINYKIDYFTNNYQNMALSIYATMALFFMTSLLMSLSSRPIILQASYKKIVSAFVIGVGVFLLSSHKSNDLLIFTIAPLAMMATTHIESAQIRWHREVVLGAVIVIALFLYFAQL